MGQPKINLDRLDQELRFLQPERRFWVRPNLQSLRTFAVGDPNALAFQTAEHVCIHPNAVGQINPIVFYGQHGQGKTHLLEGIVKRIQKKHPKRKILHLSGEKFMNQFLAALRINAGLDFKTRNYEAQVVVIDDIHFLASRQRTLEEFMYLVQHCMEEGAQIVLSINEAPGSLSGIEERLRSMLNGGLVIETKAADVALRHKIVEAHFGEQIDHLMVPAARELLVSTICDPRSLIGAVTAAAMLFATRGTLSFDQTETLLHAQLNAARQNAVIKISAIKEAVATKYSVRIDDLNSPRRAIAVARPRQIAMYLAKQLTNQSLPQIGREFGGRDHTTVIHAIKKIDELKKTELWLRPDIVDLEAKLRSER